jgi:hypothetical protein
MHTLFDFITQIKIYEYLIALTAIAGYLMLWEALKPRPFKTMANAAKEEMEHIRSEGTDGMIRTMGKIAAAPFIGLAYVAALPLTFMVALGAAVFKGAASLAGENVSFGWRPVEAYLSGSKKRKKEKKEETKQEDKEE